MCANLLFVYIILYPIKRLVQGLSIIEQLPKSKFKMTLIFFSIYVFIYIVLSVFINLVSKLKLTMFSEKGVMNSVMNEIMENNKKKGNITNEDIQKKLKEGLNKKNYIKILFHAMFNLFKMSKYIIVIIIFSIYYLGSVKYFLLNIDVELFPSNAKDESKDDNSPNGFQNYVFLSDILFSNYNVYGVYGNTQQEIQSVLGRSELEIEYTTEINNNKWYTVNFNYKLGPNNSVPKFLWFYMPRIDWKLNSAANDEDLNNDSWIIMLLGKIFERNPIIMDLLGYEVEEKKYYDKISLFEKVKEIYLGKKKYELMPEINKLKIDIFKYQYLKTKDNKNKDRIFKRKRYKEYISPIEKHTLLMVYEKIGLSKPNKNDKIQINKFQLIPVIDLVIIYFLYILLKH